MRYIFFFALCAKAARTKTSCGEMQLFMAPWYYVTRPESARWIKIIRICQTQAGKVVGLKTKESFKRPFLASASNFWARRYFARHDIKQREASERRIFNMMIDESPMEVKLFCNAPIFIRRVISSFLRLSAPRCQTSHRTPIYFRQLDVNNKRRPRVFFN